MEDYHVAKFVQLDKHELGLFAIYDGHLGDSVPAYLQTHLFANILKEVGSLFFDPWAHATWAHNDHVCTLVLASKPVSFGSVGFDPTGYRIFIVFSYL